jgi:hypothetical protein
MNDNGKCELCCRESMADCVKCGGVSPNLFSFMRELLGEVKKMRVVGSDGLTREVFVEDVEVGPIHQLGDLRNMDEEIQRHAI